MDSIKILIDLDEKKNPITLGDSIRYKVDFLSELIGIEIKLLECMETNKGYHITLETKSKLKPTEIVLIQSILGSDWKRETFNWHRIKRGLELADWNVLFSRKYKREADGSLTLASFERRTLLSVAFCLAYHFSSVRHSLIRLARDMVVMHRR